MATTTGFVSMRKIQQNGKTTSRVKAGHVVSVKPSSEDTLDPKRAKVGILRVLASSWMMGQHDG